MLVILRLLWKNNQSIIILHQQYNISSSFPQLVRHLPIAFRVGVTFHIPGGTDKFAPFFCYGKASSKDISRLGACLIFMNFNPVCQRQPHSSECNCQNHQRSPIHTCCVLEYRSYVHFQFTQELCVTLRVSSFSTVSTIRNFLQWWRSLKFYFDAVVHITKYKLQQL